MKRNFECDQCSKMYSHRQSRWRHKKNDHAIPAKLYKQTSDGSNLNERLRNILKNLRLSQIKAGDGITLNEILQKGPSSPKKKLSDNVGKVNNHTRSKNDIEKLLREMLQYLHQDEPTKEEREIENQPKSKEDVEQEIFEDVTLEERKRFYKLLEELISRESHLKREDFQNIDKLLPQYFKDEYGWKDGNKLERENKSFSEQINQELRTFQQELPLISLEMQIILNFMDKKRNLIKDLLRIGESNNKEESLERKYLWRDILGDEYNELKTDLSKDTIARVLSNRKFTPMNSDIQAKTPNAAI